jgi:hypothetical protein
MDRAIMDVYEAGYKATGEGDGHSARRMRIVDLVVARLEQHSSGLQWVKAR